MAMASKSTPDLSKLTIVGDLKSSKSSSKSTGNLKGSFESLDHFTEGKFIVTDEMKREIVEALRCGVKNDDSSVSTWTSQWVRSKGVSSYVYTLLKVKRWHLIDENYIFDPLKKCKSKFQLTPENTLWRIFPAGERSHTESMKSVDGLLLQGQASGISFDRLTKLDSMLQSLDQARQLVNNPDYYPEDTMMYFGPSGENLLSSPSNFYFEDFFTDIGQAINRLAVGDTVQEVVFQDIFCSLVQCVMACCGGVMRHIRCRQAVDTLHLDRVKLDVKLKAKDENCPSLIVTSKPDLFIFHRKDIFLPSRRVVLAVVEVKGKRNDKIVHSDDDDDVPPCSCDEKQSAQVTRPPFAPKYGSESEQSRLRTVDEEDENDSDDDDDDDEETDLEKLIDEPPAWLGKIRQLPPTAQKAIKKFLPQLIGEMYCAARCKRMKPLKHKDGLLFGIGVVGFEVYFVSMMDSCRDSGVSVVNDESAVTNVFVTRPFDLLVKKDRRIILKTICASFMLHQ